MKATSDMAVLCGSSSVWRLPWLTMPSCDVVIGYCFGYSTVNNHDDVTIGGDLGVYQSMLSFCV
jgi:hypothetical protein